MNSVLVWVALLQAASFFRIEPVRPVAELRAQALRLQPPAETGDFLPTDLAELTALDVSIHLDIRYAGTRNFLGTPVYTQARAFLQRPAAGALVRAHRRLKEQGYGILVHDGYRPWWVTWVFWEATPAAQHDFVADPQKGSRHNRGCAADITLYDLKSGAAVEMPSLYDEMSERAYPDYPGGTAEQRRLRGLLRDAMEREGFQVYEYEWWHFDYKDWRRYRVANLNFEAIPRTAR
ncbi:M15 family metallopeptidase [uncultured Paludibaculum sp.]|uniref:M15 family metallopeptidase n=1 Tax=uncultured Paludibaculum sp. TaxID=1765020 RepID=UPI002AAC165E|nr:M15 family metallopeptidase [uncultured Paludibaculum sp.]